MVRDKWSELSPKSKRLITIGAAAGSMLFVIWFFSGDTPERERRGANETVRHILTDRDTRDVSIDGLAAQIQLTNQQNDTLRNEVSALQRQLRLTQSGQETTENVREELNAVHSQLEMLIEQNMELSRLAEERQHFTPSPDSTGQHNTRPLLGEGESPFEALGYTSRGSDPGGDDPNPYAVDPEVVFSQPIQRPASQWEDPDVPSSSGNTPADRQNADAWKDRAQGSEQASTNNDANIIQHAREDTEDAGKDEDEPMYLPAGSIITGVLLNGMDAPTNSGARRNPFPSLLRVNHEAILPNRFTADLRECHLMIAGHGDLSSERAYLRGETISCIRNDGGVIEARLDAYAVGEDGKTGVRGRLVSKQGAMIARSMVAGFMSGAANAFDVDPIPFIQTAETVTDATGYQSNFAPSMFQGAAAGGASQALNKVAEFYVDMAENIFPVIEVDAGREVELVMTRGASLSIR